MVSPAAQAADLTWSYAGGTALASNPANWIGGVAPTDGDGVLFGNTTPTSPCTWDLALTIASMSVSGSYASTVTLTVDLTVSSGVWLGGGSSAMLDLNGHNLSVQGDWTVGSMKTTSTVAGSTVTFYGTGTSNITRTGGGVARFNYLVIDKTAGQTEQLLSDIEVFGLFTILTGNHVAGKHSQHLHGGLLLTEGFLDVSVSTLVFVGDRPQALASNGEGGATFIGAIFIQAPAAITLPGVQVAVLVATQPSSTLILQTPIDPISITSMTISGLAATSRIQIQSLVAGQAAQVITTAPTVRFAFVRDIDVSQGTAITATSSVDGGGNTGWTFSGGDPRATRFWSWGGGSALASNAGNWAAGGPPGAGDYVVFGSTTPTAPCTWDLSVVVTSMSVTNAYASTVTLTVDLTVSSGVLLDAGSSAKLDLNGRNLSVQGDWAAGGVKTTSTVAGSSVTFYGAGTSHILRTTGGPALFNSLVAAKASGATLMLLSDIETFGTFTASTGAYLVGAHTQRLHGGFFVGDGAVDVSVSTLVFTGSQPQSLGPAVGAAVGSVTNIGALFIQTPAVISLVQSDIQVFVATQPNATVLFESGSVTEIASMTVSGLAASSRVQLRGGSDGVAAQLTLGSAPTLAFVYARDIDSSLGVAVTASNSVDGGGNTNWTFIGGGGGALKTWSYGGGSSAASASANWVPSGAPAAGDSVVFGNTTPTSPCAWDLAVTLASMSITGGYASTVTLTVDLSISSGATFDAGSSAMLDLNGRALAVTGDWLVGDMRTTSTVAGSTVVFTGGGVSKIKRLTAGPARFNHLVINKLAAAGVMETLLSDLEVRGNFTVLSGSHTAGSHYQYFHQNIVLANGYLDSSLSTTVIAGTSPQRFYTTGEGDATALANLYVQTSSTFTLPEVPVGIFIATQPSTTLVFDSLGSAMQVTSLVLNGQAAGTRQTIRSSSDGTRGKMTAVFSDVSFTAVKDIDSSGGGAISAASSLDRGNNLNWTFPVFGVISASSWTAIGATSVTVHWDSSFPPGLSYTANLSSAPWPNVFAGNQSSTTLNLFATFGGAVSLLPNTSYYLQVSTSAGGPFTVLGDSGTLSKPVLAAAVYAVNGASVTANWFALPSSPPDASSKTAEGYLLQASTSPTYTGLIFSSSTPNAALSTLTVSGLSGLTTYYLRVGGLNWRGAPNFVSISSVVTPLGLPLGCAVAAEVAKTGYAFTTIASALASFGGSLAVDSCVVIRDTQTYSEQVSVSGLAMNDHRLSFVTADPSQAGPAVINPPAGSTAAFYLANASVTITNMAIITTNTVAYGVYASSAYVTLARVSVDSGGKIWTAGVAVSSWSSVADSSITVQSADGLRLNASLGSTILYSTASAAGSGFSALFLSTADNNTVANAYFLSQAGPAVRLVAGSDYNAISLSTMVSNAASAATTNSVLYLSHSDSNTVTGSYVQNLSGALGIYLDVGSDYNTIAYSTGVTNSSAVDVIGAQWSSGTAITGSFLRNMGAGWALGLDEGANYTSVSASTFIAGAYGLWAWGGNHHTTVSDVYIQVAQEVGLSFNASPSNTVTNARIYASSAALDVQGCSGNSFSQIYAYSANGHGAYLALNTNTVISMSTMASNGTGYGLYVQNSSSDTILGSYIQGSTAVYVSGSTGTVIGGSVLAVTIAAGDGLVLSSTSVNLSLSSSTVSGGAQGRALFLADGNKGRIVLSTNVFQGGRYAVYAATQQAGTQLWIASNTVLPTLSAAYDTYGIYLDGLATGATIQNNGIYYRAAGSMGAFTAYGLHARSVAGLVVDHNRISQPDVLSAGGFEAVSLAGAVNSTLKFNDLYGAASVPLTNAYVLRLHSGSTGVAVKNNVLSSSFSVTGASATIAVSGDSQTGFSADYNDFYSSNSANSALWGLLSYDLLAAWRAASSQDANSAAVLPRWKDPGAGVEDFHPLSQSGRWNPATGSFAADAQTSQTIDRGDPLLGAGLEANPNGGRANQGSYGLTAEASQSYLDLPAGCGAGYNVKQDGSKDYTTIQAAVTALSFLGTDSCVVVRDTQTYNEQVTVQNLANNGFRLTIMADPGFISSAPVINPPTASTAAFLVINDSVTLQHLTVITTNTVAYGVWSSSAYVTLSSVNVDSGGKIWTAGVAVSSWSSVSYGSITVQSADGLRLNYAIRTTVQYSTVAVSGDDFHALYLTASDSNTVTGSYFQHSAAGYGAFLTNGSDYNVISQSSLACNHASALALLVIASDNNTVTGSVISNLQGQGVGMNTGADYNTFSQSVLSANSATAAAFFLSDCDHNTVVDSTIRNTAGDGAILVTGSDYNAIIRSTMTSAAVAADLYPLYIGESSSNTIVDSYIQGSTAAVIHGSTATVIGGSVLIATHTAGSALWMSAGSLDLSLSTSTLVGGAQGAGLFVDEGNSGRLLISTNSFPAAARYAVYAATQQPGTQLWISSNTVLPSLSASRDTFGIYLNGLVSGATIQNNGIFYRSAGSMGAFTSYGLYAQSAAGLLIDRNRFGAPGMITAGSHEAVKFSGTTNSSFKSNDVHVAGAGLTNAYGLSVLSGSTGVKVKDNVFLSSTAVIGSSATISVSADSQPGFVSDYNSYYSSNAYSTGFWGAAAYALTSAWTAGSGQDANSLDGQHPYWADPSAGVEDYHPRSPRGRYDPGTGGFVVDGVLARSIDAGDPAEAVGLEPSPNGSRLNAGSYGGTAEASKAAPAPTGQIAGAVDLSSITLTFGAVASDGYNAQAATDPGFASVISSATANAASTQLSPQGLALNTTYYVRVGALYGSAVVYPLGAAVSTPTLAAVPAEGSEAVVFTSSIIVSWAANGNPAGTLYSAQLSTDAFVTINESSRTMGSAAAFLNLLPNTTYQARVQAINHAGLATDFGASLATATWAGDLQGVSLYGVFATSVTVNWVPLALSPPDASSKTSSGYVLVASTAADFSGTQFSSATSNVALSTLSLTGLSNATYYLRLGALNWNGSANYSFVAATHTASSLPPGCLTGFNVKQDGSMDHVTLQGALNAMPPGLTGDACLVIRDALTYSEQVTIQGFSNNGYRLRIMADPTFVSSAPVFNPPAGSTAAFLVFNDSVTLQQISIITTNTVAYGVWSSSAYVALSSVSVDGRAGIWSAGVRVSSGSSIERSSITVLAGHGLVITGPWSVVSYATSAVVGAGDAALVLDGASSSTITNGRFYGNFGGAQLKNGAHDNVISLSTMTGNGGLSISVGSYSNIITQSYAAGFVSGGAFIGGNYNTLSQSVITGNSSIDVNGAFNTLTGLSIPSPGGYGLVLSGGADYNTVTLSTISVLRLTGGSYNTVSRSLLSAPVITGGSIGNLVTLSTITAGLQFLEGSSNTVSSCYIEGSTAVIVAGATGTVVSSNFLAATSALGSGLWLRSGSVNLSMSSNTVSGGAQGAGIALEAGAGRLILSTNTIRTGAQYGIRVAAQGAGAQVWITSNTVLPTLSTSLDTYGIHLNGLITGATIQDNGVYYRTALAIPGVTAYGLYALGSSGLVIDHNRFNEPGKITSGSHEAVSLWATTNSSLLFNDLHATGANFNNAVLLSVRSASTGVQVKGNVFLSSFSVSGASATIEVSADSQSGFVSDYNDFFSSAVLNSGTWGASSYDFLAAWRSGTGRDLNSLAAQPLWNDASGGVEDFHPRSQRGRWDPAAAGFVVDGVTALTIDAADPAAAAGLEASPNGARANLGSYGQTLEASKSAPTAAPVLLGVSGSSVTLSWALAASDGYSAEVSSVADFSSGIVSSVTTNGSSTQLSPQSLLPNTTYTLRVGTLYGAVYNYAASGATATWAHPPVAAVFSVGLSSHGLSWGRNGNPEGTLYAVEQSTDAFLTLNASSWTLNAGATFFGLVSNKDYSLRVRALGHGGTATAFLTPSSSFTLTADPASTSTAVNLSSAVLTWSSPSNDVGTPYDAQVSTDDFATVNLTSATLSQSATFTALTPNTTYYLRVRSSGHYGPGGFAAASPSVTLPDLPVSPAVSGVWVTSAALSWAAGGNPAGTEYLAQDSTDAFVTVNSSSRTLLTSATFFGLLSNATHYLRVAAWSHAGAQTAFAVAAATATSAAEPASAPPSAITANSLQADWSPNGNAPLTTLYEAQISTDAFSTLRESSATLNVSAGFGGLLSNTTYYVRVRASGHDGRLSAFTVLPATMTLLLPPVPAGSSFFLVEQSSVAVQWNSGGNGPTTVYVAQVSTDGFATLNFSSSTLNLTVLYGAGGAGPALSPNTTYQFQVRATGGGNSSADIPLGSTSTLAAVPAASAALPSVSSMSLTWTSAGNGAGTVYQAELSTDVFVTLNASSQTLSLSATFQALVPNTTYYLRARAVNNNGVPSSYAAAMTTVTLPAPPSPSLAAINLSSMTVDWLANADPAGTVYLAQLSTDAFTTLNTSSQTLNLSATFQALVPNTTYYLRVQAIGWAGALSPFASAAAAPTLAATPAGASLTAVELSSAALSWSANGNPAGTRFAVQLSTDDFSTLSASSSTLLTSATFFGLLSNATYYLRVQALSHAFAATGFAVGPATATPPALPVSAQPSAVAAAAFQANWSANGNAPLTTRYEAELSTDTFATLNESSATFNAAAGFAGLLSNTTYYVRVRAFGHGGQVTGFATLPSTTTLLLPPGLTAGSFLAVETASAAVQWTSGGNGPGAFYAAELSTDAFATVNFSSLTLSLSTLFGSGGAGSALSPNTTYFFQVRTVGPSNVSANVALGSTSTLAAPPAAPAAGPSVSSMSLTWGSGGDPAGTRYQAQLSTDAFTTLNITSQTLNVSATFQALVPNTTYYLRVRALNSNELPTVFIAAAPAFTLPASPAAPALSAIALSSMTLDWSADGNPAGTVYLAQLSTDGFTTLNLSSQTLSLSATFQALAPNTTYYLHVQALGWGGSSPFAQAAAAPTLAVTPAAPFLSAVELSSAALSWGAGGNPAATPYLAQISTDAFTTVNASSNTLLTSATFFALQSNATYYLRVQAFNAASMPTAFVAVVATATLPAEPAALAPTFVGPAAVTANWTANGNASGTLYEARVSTDEFSTLNASSGTYGVSAAFAGLSANTTYYFQVRALGHGGRLTSLTTLPSTTTLLAEPGAGAPSLVAVDFASVTVSWTDGGNPPGTGYEADLSSDAFASVNFSSSTLNLSVVFGAGGAGADLLANTTYYFRVRARSGANASTVKDLGSAASPAFSPSATEVLSVTSSTVSLDWLPQGNPDPGTVYELWRDVSAAFASPVKTLVSVTDAEAAGLSPSTTYYFKARTLGHNGGVTTFDATVSTRTEPAAPGQPGVPVGAALGVSSISWTWGAAADAVGYYVFPASNTASIIGNPAAAAFSHLGLATNTAYGLVVAGINVSGQGPLSAAATAYTLAAPPTGSVISLVQGTSATISWSLNTNPADTLAEVQHSTDNAAFSLVSLSSVVAYADTGLLGCTTYYLRVRNRNGDAVATAFDGTVSFVTLASTPSAPSGLAANALTGNRISLSWTASPTEGITAYKLYYDAGTGAVDFVTPAAVFTSTETSYTTGVLVSSPTYLFALRAAHRCGVEETSGVYASASSTASVSAVRAQIKSPVSGKRIAGDRVTVSAQLLSGTDAQTKSVLFQYKASSDTAWLPVVPAGPTQTNGDLSAPWFLHWDVTGLTATSYDLRAVAADISDSSDTTPGVVTVVVDPAGWDVRERLVGSLITREEVLNNGAPQAITGAGVGSLVTKIDLPAGSLSGSSTTVSVVNSPVLPAAAPEGTQDVGISMSITLGNGQTLLSGGNSATLTFTYLDANDDGILDGTSLRAQDLKLYSFDTVTNQWTADLTTTIDLVNHTVYGATRHFSFFAAFPLAGAANLDTVRVYPVPFKPNGVNPDEGRPFSPGNVNSGIVFDNLPAAVTIKVFTVSGKLAAQFSSANSGGRLQWNARNEDGRELATGGYFAVIASPGQKSIIKRLSIIR